MKSIIAFILGVTFASIVVLLCFSSCYLASKSDEYWENLKDELEKKDDERH